jgi:hypothetical protein
MQMQKMNSNYLMKKGFLINLTVLLCVPVLGQQLFSKQTVVEDLDFLRKSLDEAHYDLYAYVTEQAFNENFEAVRSSIGKDSLSLLETTSLFQSVISKANNGHTEIPFPGASYREYAYAGGTLFPLEIAFEDGKALIRKNWSGNESLKIGSEIISINHQTIDEILEKIYPLISAERRYFKLAKIELTSFPRLYWQAFGEQKDFVIEIKENGLTKTYELQSINLIDDYEMKRNEIFSGKRALKFFDQSAYLKPGNFSGNEEDYRRFIDSSFAVIKQRNLPNLIIDLRNNLGGENAFSDYLVSYIADRPFRWYSEFTLKTSAILKAHVQENYDTTSRYWQSILSHKDGSMYSYEFEAFQAQAEHMRYSGEVYVLVNRQTHSQAAVTAAQIQDYHFATIVGEESGDFPTLYASQYNFLLPHTGIEVKIAKGYIVRVNGSKKGEGVIPDIYIKDHLLDEHDEILNELLSRIEKKH